MTSHDVVGVVRRLAGQRKVGHTGTLDPDATGVLVVCLGRATRLARFLQDGPKTYRATVRFGQVTSTQDAAGEVLAETDASRLDDDDVRAAFADLTGDIEQVPPMVSAVKVDGERLHAKARRGETVERDARPVTVHDLVVERFRPGVRPEADLVVTCSAGTYVRTLAHDAGAALGVGAHLAALRRTVNGGFTAEEASTLERLEQHADDGSFTAQVWSMRAAVRSLPQVEVAPDLARAIAFGQRVPAVDVDGVYALVQGERLLAVARDDGDVSSYEAVFVRPEEIDG